MGRLTKYNVLTICFGKHTLCCTIHVMFSVFINCKMLPEKLNLEVYIGKQYHVFKIGSFGLHCL